MSGQKSRASTKIAYFTYCCSCRSIPAAKNLLAVVSCGATTPRNASAASASPRASKHFLMVSSTRWATSADNHECTTYGGLTMDGWFGIWILIIVILVPSQDLGVPPIECCLREVGSQGVIALAMVDLRVNGDLQRFEELITYSFFRQRTR